MSDLENEFPSWGETGELPTSGTYYEKGDQVNEKHLDALWYNIKTHFDSTNTAIRDRIRDIEGDVILDSGLVSSEGTGTLEIDVSASSEGAYVDGQKTGSIGSTTVTLSSNGGTSTRTDSVWVNTNGSVGKTDGATSVATDRMKIAEVDVATNDSVSAVRNVGRDRVHTFASENNPSNQSDGDLWYDLLSDKFKGRVGGAWRNFATETWVNNGIQSEFNTHAADEGNPHNVTVGQLDAYSTSETYSTTQADSNFAPASHNHDGRYYTENESDSRYIQSIPSETQVTATQSGWANKSESLNEIIDEYDVTVVNTDSNYDANYRYTMSFESRTDIVLTGTLQENESVTLTGIIDPSDNLTGTTIETTNVSGDRAAMQSESFHIVGYPHKHGI
ncbi:hypothetical protein [Natrinema sp. DC36]|uniref:hypothetical protein n=1 Tax=Natrinema sp. DC36 TaxID=2878680 RepID=UPI001CF05AF0|nr:hypothetical protein [Natrinema sp. DC36]